ncbi:hypothetical protein BH10ACT2_BH10ACT2_00140 [soil metagenome]
MLCSWLSTDEPYTEVTIPRTDAASIRGHASINAVSNIGLAFLGIISGSLVSYKFGPEGRGTIGVVQVISALCAGFGALGLGDALLYWIASRRDVSLRLVIRSSIAATVVAGVFGTSMGLVVSRRIDVPGDGGAFVAFCGMVAAATAFYTVPTGALRGSSLFARWNALRLLAATSWIAAIVAVALIGGGLRILVIGCIYSVALVALGLNAIARVAPELQQRVGAPAHDRRLRPLLKFGLPSAFASAPLLLNARIDQVALAFNGSASTVGLYVAAAGYCWATVPLGQAIASLTATRVAAHRDAESRAAALRELSRLGVTVIGVSGVGAWLVAPFALRVLNGPSFGDAAAIARILLVGASLQGVTYLLEEGSRGLGLPKLAMYAELAGLGTMVVGLVLFSRGQAIPTALISTAGYVVSFLVIVLALMRATGSNPWSLLQPASLSQLRGLRSGETANN